MCGIAGFTHTNRETPRVSDTILKHRGPDASGEFSDAFISLRHWRLSIIDPTNRANQPFHYKDLVIVYNGELYNFREVRTILRNHGYRFTSESDTEVIIMAFDLWAEECVRHFRGMFSFAVYNSRTQEVCLFRDRLGVKPLYYSLERGLEFASEVKFFKGLSRDLSVDPISLHQYFRWGYVAGERTIYRNIFKLKPGCYLKYSKRTAVITSYWQIPLPQECDIGPEEQCIRDLEGILKESFAYRMVSDVPVGIFLSGGIDSSLLATLLQNNSSRPLNTFTIGFDAGKFSEAPFAREIASRLGTNHTEHILGVSEAKHLLRDFYSIYDEPFSDSSGIPTALVSSLARKAGIKVVLSADGADELFGGYPRYIDRSHWFRIRNIPAPVRRSLTRLGRLAFSPANRRSIVGFNFQHRLEMLEELFDTRDVAGFYESVVANQAHREVAELTRYPFTPQPLLRIPPGVDEISAMMYWDATFYLPDDLLVKVDRATMHYGVEAREPFLDHHIVEFAQRLPMKMKIRGNTTKYILRRILSRYHPEHLFHRPKQGFSIPIFEWFTNELDELFREYLDPARVESTGLLNSKVVVLEKTRYERNKSRGKDYNMEKMWRILSFMMWHERWMK